MKNLFLLIMGITIFGLSGCISISSDKSEPVKETEKIIVVPEDEKEKKVKVVPAY